MLENLKSDKSIDNESDMLGGNRVLESDAYEMAIEMAYTDKSAGGAMSLNLNFKGKNGETLRQTLWMTSGTAKGGNNFYLDKSGKKQYLPGFNQANSLCLLTVGKEISELSTETKTLNLYDFKLKKEVPTQKEVVMALIGQSVKLGVMKQIVDKTAKNDAGEYVPTGETREENDINKIFRAKDGLTSAEIRAEETEPKFLTRWLEKNKDLVLNKAKGATENTGTADTPTANNGGKTESLFG